MRVLSSPSNIESIIAKTSCCLVNTLSQKNGEKGEFIFRELSLTGIQFENLKPNQFSKYDILEVKFKIDNPLRTEIRKPVKVIWVRDRIVGAQFSESKLYEKDLGFYMRT